ncbi:MAG: hypothetical protein H0Z37_00365 [Firmicutes bacterium]|nr:hypothetical protein [Bacillota bacterium]
MVGWSLPILLLFSSGAIQAAPLNYRALRYTGVIAQTAWYTCGPAAVATLLSQFFAMPVTEADVLRLAAGAMRASGRDPEEGISALALQRAMETFGLPVRGYRVSVPGLREYFLRGGLPVIAHVTAPELHYIVIVGSTGDYAVVADPSWGRRVVRWHELIADKGFDGVILVPLPAGDQEATARARQAEVVAWANARLAQLDFLGRMWP